MEGQVVAVEFEHASGLTLPLLTVPTPTCNRYQLVEASTAEAAKRFQDGSFDWIYLDATHTYSAARDDLRVWWPKLRVGGLMSGHDYQFQHQAIGDGYTFGVRDAVDEFAAGRRIRVYSTMESYLPSFYFLKCAG